MRFNTLMTTAMLATAAVWHFAAAPTARTTAKATNPADSAMEVPPDQPIAVTFSGPMDPRTINPLTFKLKLRGMPVFGAVTYANGTAIFTPYSILEPRTRYTARMLTGARSMAGAPLAADLEWSFTTSFSFSELPVKLKTSQDFFHHANSTSTSPGINTQLTGSIGQSPVSGTNITGSLQTDVAGTIYTLDGKRPTVNRGRMKNDNQHI